jgi:alkylation response protein AidB-like acyl-CoA dehydrogenase
VPDADTEDLRKTVRAFLERKAPVGALRRNIDGATGYDLATWRQLGGELELTGIGVPVELGGSGGGMTGLVVVMEELGRVLYDGPFLSSAVLAAEALVASGSAAAQRQLLPGIVSGETIATLALLDDVGRWDRIDSGVAARSTDDGWRLDGHKTFVLDGSTADVVLVVGRTPSGPTLFSVERSSGGLTSDELVGIDPSRRQARLTFVDVPATPVGPPGRAGLIVDQALSRAACALAAEQLGAAETCLAMSVDYARTRQAFGRVIGSFQAIKHLCADMFLEIEMTRSAVEYAAAAADSGSADFVEVASLAKAQASAALVTVAKGTIQVHGGIGFTEEHDAHLYFKRAHAANLLLGPPRFHLDIVAAEAGI